MPPPVVAPLSETIMPDYVSTFLRVTKQLQDLRQLEKQHRVELLRLQPQVGNWLQARQGLEINLGFAIPEQVQEYGAIGKLKFGLDVRKEYLSKSNITGYLISFFSELYVDKARDDIELLATAAVTHIWHSRKITKHAPVVVRTFTATKRKSEALV